MKITTKFRITAALSIIAISTAAWGSANITGRWITQKGDAVVEIAPCGGAMCGRIVKYLITPKGGVDQLDVKNPDPKLRSRKLLGSAILTGLTPDGDGWHGQIYDPRAGKVYKSVVSRNGSNLSMKGCWGVFCQTQIWTPAK